MKALRKFLGIMSLCHLVFECSNLIDFWFDGGENKYITNRSYGALWDR